MPPSKRRRLTDTTPTSSSQQASSSYIEGTTSSSSNQSQPPSQSTPSQEPPTSTPGTLPQKHLKFQEWAISQGVTIHPSITPAVLSGRGVGLQTTSSIPSKTRILFIPERAIFKPRPEEFKPHPNLSPHAHLALSAFNSFPHDSELELWKATWPPAPELLRSLPLFWRPELREGLPPATKAILERQISDFESDKKEVVDVKDDEFEYYWAIVNSRSFHWKPLGGRPGYMVLCPFIDYLNHGPQGTGVDVRQTGKGFEVWTERGYEPNEELLLTYGAHSNDKLLVHYGFLHCPAPLTTTQTTTTRSLRLDDLTDDSINLDHILLPHFSPSVKLSLQDEGFLGNYTYTPSSSSQEEGEVQGEFCFRTQVAIRAQLLSANEWEFFRLNGVDMGVDRSKEVEEWLKGPLKGFLEEARGKLGKLEGKGRGLQEREEEEEEGAVEMVRLRWKQIEEGICEALRLNRGS